MSTKFFHRKDRGFTLIELLVVVSIISLVSSIVFASINSAREEGRDAKRISDIRQVKVAMELHYDSYGYYPSVGDDNTPYPIKPDLEETLSAFIEEMPDDPLGLDIDWEYIRGTPETASYGFLVYFEEIDDYCQTGVNLDLNSGWWTPVGGVGFPPPLCPF